jgi:MFS family permease
MKFTDWAVVLVLAATGTFLGMAFTVVSPVLPLIIEHFGGATGGGALIGQWILAIPSIGVVIGGPSAGWLVERIGARQVLFASLAGFAVAGASGLYIESPVVLLGTRLILGIAAVGGVTAAISIIGERYTEAQRGSMLGFQNAIATIFSIVSILAAGAIGQRQGWKAPFELYSTSLIILLLALFVIPATPRPRRVERARSRLSDFAPLLPTYLLVTMTFIISFFSAATIPQLLGDDGFTDPKLISIILGIGTVLMVLGGLFYGFIRHRIGMRWTIALGLALQGAGVLWIAIGHGMVGIGLGTALLNLGSGIQTPNLSHLILDRAPIAIRGRAVGLLFSAQFLGPVLNSAIIAPAMGIFGMRGTLLVIGGLIGVGVLAIVLRGRALPLAVERH